MGCLWLRCLAHPARTHTRLTRHLPPRSPDGLDRHQGEHELPPAVRKLHLTDMSSSPSGFAPWSPSTPQVLRPGARHGRPKLAGHGRPAVLGAKAVRLPHSPPKRSNGGGSALLGAERERSCRSGVRRICHPFPPPQNPPRLPPPSPKAGLLPAASARAFIGCQQVGPASH